MRIAFFVGSFPEISETFILQQIIGLLDLGHEVDIYSEGRPKDNVPIHQDVIKYNLLNNITYLVDNMPEVSAWEMPVWPVSGETWLPGNEKPTSNQSRIEDAAPYLINCLANNPKLAFEVLDSDEYGMEANSLSALYRLSILSGQLKKYDVIHAHFGPVGNTFRFVKQLWNAPLIVTFHGYDFSSYPKLHHHGVYNKLFAEVDIVTVNSRFAAGCISKLGCLADKIFQLNVGLNIKDFSFHKRGLGNNETVRILTVGRLVEKKGFDTSIRSMAKVVEKYPLVQYHIIGEGIMRPIIFQLIKELKLENNVTLLGSRDASYVQQLMSKAHLFILASQTSLNGDQEGTPVSLMEASASGLPVISSLHSGIPEIIKDSFSGFLVPEGDVDALAERIIYLIDHPDIWPEMGLHGRIHIEQHYDINMLNNHLVDIYKIAIDKFQSSNNSLIN